MLSPLSNTCDLFSRIFEVFNETERIFTKLYLKITVRGREISYCFPVKSKPHERIDLLITASVNMY